MLQQLDCSQEVQDKLSILGSLAQKNSLIFEDPVTNFLFISILLDIDNEENIVPAMMKKSFQRTVTMPSREKLEEAAAGGEQHIDWP